MPITCLLTFQEAVYSYAAGLTKRPCTSPEKEIPYYRRKPLTIERNPLLQKETPYCRKGLPVEKLECSLPQGTDRTRMRIRY